MPQTGTIMGAENVDHHRDFLDAACLKQGLDSQKWRERPDSGQWR